MKFLTGTRFRSGKFTVIPARPMMDMTTGQSHVTPPLRCKVEDHKFDSASPGMMAQYEDYVTAYNVGKDPSQHLTVPDVQKKVENYLLNHPDFGRADGRGIFLDRTDTLANIELKAKGVKRRCIFVQDLGEDSIQCGEFVENPESDFCEVHEGILESALGAAEELAEEREELV